VEDHPEDQLAVSIVLLLGLHTPLVLKLEDTQEFLGHADSKTTQIYAHYAPSEHEVQIVNEAFTVSSQSPKPELGPTSAT
jgi:integrase